MAMESWVGVVRNIVLSTADDGQDWVVVKLSNQGANAPKWYPLELGRRTPAALAQLNLLRDAMNAKKSVRLWVDRASRSPNWQEALIREIEFPKLPARKLFS